MFVAIVLHAHLPYVRHPEHARSLEERWLYEAIWESYLPIIALLDHAGGVGAVKHPLLTLSLSPTLMAMLGDEHHRARFEVYLDELRSLADRALGHPSYASLRAGIEAHITRIDAARRTWVASRRDVVGALVALERRGVVELATTVATHAFLPGLREPACVRAQLRLGKRWFEHVTGHPSVGLWLPECAYDPRFASDLVRADVRYAVLDTHGIELASPRSPAGVLSPILAPNGVAFIGREPELARIVWSRRDGYPGDPCYRDFHRDIGADAPAELLGSAMGPHGSRVMTGIKPWAVTGHDDKRPYDASRALVRARTHAADFVQRAETILTQAREQGVIAPLAVAPYDAELFGHWWFEGPTFLEHLLALLAKTERAGGPAAISLGAFLRAHPDMAVSSPAASSWGEGGFSDVWAHPSTARLWRHVHHAQRRVLDVDARVRDLPSSPLERRARIAAIRELMLLQASDLAFLIRAGDTASYAEARAVEHASNVDRMARLALARESTPEDVALLERLDRDCPLFGDLPEDSWADLFDPW